MKIGILSDAHGNIFGLRAVLKSMGPVEKLIFAGDVSGYYYWVNECLDLLKEYKAEMVLGNHDLYLLQYLGYKRPEAGIELDIPTEEQYREKYGIALKIAKQQITQENRNFLISLSSKKNIQIANKKILLVHGSPWNSSAEYIYSNYEHWNKFSLLKTDIVILGHTHHPLVHTVGNCLVINPGSCGQPRDYNPMASYAVLDLEVNTVKIYRVAYDVEAVIAEINRIEPNNELIKKILVRKKKYDH